MARSTLADAKSRRTLADGYFQLGELTDKIGSKPEALAEVVAELVKLREAYPETLLSG